MRGALDDDVATFFPNRVGREDRLHRDHFFLEQLTDRRLSFEPLTVIDEDGVALKRAQHGFDIETGIRVDIVGDGCG